MNIKILVNPLSSSTKFKKMLIKQFSQDYYVVSCRYQGGDFGEHTYELTFNNGFSIRFFKRPKGIGFLPNSLSVPSNLDIETQAISFYNDRYNIITTNNNVSMDAIFELKQQFDHFFEKMKLNVSVHQKDFLKRQYLRLRQDYQTITNVKQFKNKVAIYLEKWQLFKDQLEKMKK